ncbi:hypothetical protein Gogos_003471 [Gossypium gossypioides]|uniref:Uncharacterized protein n=1 Tax=Gossypium gossypioides TaxID=34282 RepID=A0A7J9CM60_GOSGO|nr:hypothetical protein [Gossypium gossypioides]
MPGDASGQATECDVDQWLSAPVVVVGLVATTIFTSQGDRPIYVLVGDKDVKVSLIVYATVEMHETYQERSRQIWVKRSRRLPQHTRRGCGCTMGSSSAPAKDTSPIVAQYPGHFDPDVDAEPRVRTDTDVSTTTDASAHATVNGDVDTQYLSDVLKIWGILRFHAYKKYDDGADPKNTIAQRIVVGTYLDDDDNEEKVYKPLTFLLILVSIDDRYAIMDGGITGEPINDHYVATSSIFSKYLKMMPYKYHTKAIGTFNLHSCSKVSTIVDAKGLSGGEWLLRCSKGDAPFGAMTVVVITQPINNYNRCRADSSLTSTVSKHPLSS